ncbi:hypothetical protein MN032_17885 [Agromyces atrinae]|uniref:hypothetical protein n=1 Tax=Agromyces atrinae TaxID=592376 RepID=UPI001F59E7B8|nr:hypothetical protein [Agromyces atrinae]MCI2959559.1 hypothetical protein [Agromyces atrinae]
MSASGTAIIRTLTAYAVGMVASAILLANIAVPDAAELALAGFFTIVFSNAYYLLVTWIAQLVPWVGYLLLIPKEPTYGDGRDLLWSFLRTLIPSIAGYLLALIPESFIVIDPATQTTLVVAIVSTSQGIYYAVLKTLERRAPWLSVLLGGRPSAQPRYLPKHAA